jgi:phosphoheptose isomerase
MDNYDRIAGAFHRRIDSIAGAVDAMAPGIDSAAQLLTQAVLEDRKILICGCAGDAGIATHVAATLRTPGDAGPALPTLAFTSDEAPSDHSQLWRDLRTLSRDGDVLLCIDSSAGAQLARRSVHFAVQRNLVAIAVSEPLDGIAGTRITLQAENPALRSELILMACHCLQEQIKLVMLGE